MPSVTVGRWKEVNKERAAGTQFLESLLCLLLEEKTKVQVGIYFYIPNEFRLSPIWEKINDYYNIFIAVFPLICATYEWECTHMITEKKMLPS